MTLVEALRDPLWQFVGAVMAVIAVTVTIWIYAVQRPRKRLLVERIARVPLIAQARGIPGIRLTFEDRELHSAIVVIVRIHANGNAPIVALDFESPLRIEFEPEATVLAATAVETFPIGITLNLSCEGAAVVVHGQLLNPDDKLVLRLLLENSKGEFSATARIAGVSKIERSQPSPVSGAGLVLMGMTIALVSLWLSPPPASHSFFDIREDELLYAFGVSCGMAFIVTAIVKDSKKVIMDLRRRLSSG